LGVGVSLIAQQRHCDNCTLTALDLLESLQPRRAALQT
jgi:cation transport ATPase